MGCYAFAYNWKNFDYTIKDNRRKYGRFFYKEI